MICEQKKPIRYEEISSLMLVVVYFFFYVVFKDESNSPILVDDPFIQFVVTIICCYCMQLEALLMKHLIVTYKYDNGKFD